MGKIIIVDNSNIKSIKTAEQMKTKLENNGLFLFKTEQIGFNKFMFIYNEVE